MYSYNSLSFSGPSPAELRLYLIVSFETTWFPFCCLLRLAGLRWRYSNPPPHGELLCRVTYRLIAHKDMAEMVLNT
jgi:hypothetical protein